MYVLDSGNNRVAKLDPAGNQTYPVVAGTGNPLQTINAFALDGGGQIYSPEATLIPASNPSITKTGQARLR